MWHEIDLAGILISPIVVASFGAVALLLLLRVIARHFGLLRAVWHPAAFELSLFLLLLTALLFRN